MGRTLDTQVVSPTADLSPIGVEKQSFVSALYAAGAAIRVLRAGRDATRRRI